jgi:DNA repair protein RadC
VEDPKSEPDFPWEPGSDDLNEAEPIGPLLVPARRPHDLPRALRPREKLFARGLAALTNAELLALVLGSGCRAQPAARTAERLLRRHGLSALSQLDVRSLQGRRGVGPATAARIAAVFELGRRALRGTGEEERPRVCRPREAYEQVRFLARAKKEQLVGLYLDAQNGLIHRETLSMGTLNTTRTHPREILFPAIAHLALGFILAHNHPSGCLEPSREDVDFTRSVRRAAELMGIELYDHLIVSRGGFTSLRERGVL